jgi:chemotaxis-related protein WspD
VKPADLPKHTDKTAPPRAGEPDELYACWNEIGVYGEGTCPDLPQFIHCRNCPVYSSAGARLLDRPLLPEYLREITEHFAQPKQRTVAGKISAVLFRIREEWLALPTQAFQEVAERRLIHSLPHRRQGIVLGLVNVRGELLICVSLARLLSLDPGGPEKHATENPSRLLVVAWNGHRLVIPVDEVLGIRRFQPDELKSPPATVVKSSLTYTRAMLRLDERSIGLLDTESLFAALNRNLT